MIPYRVKHMGIRVFLSSICLELRIEVRNIWVRSSIVSCSVRTPFNLECKMNVHKTFKSRPGCLLNVLYTFSARSASNGVSAS